MIWLIVAEYLSHMATISSVVIETVPSFVLSSSLIGFLIRLTQRVPLLEQELLTRLEHPSSPPVLLRLVFLNL
jgi:hypothetical protein